MIRLNLKPSIVKHLNFNKKEKTLEIEFKKHVKAARYLNIPLSMLQDYVESLKHEDLLDTKEEFHSNLKVVYSNFKAC